MNDCFKIGGRVRWRRTVAGSDWIGVVTGLDGNYAECDGRGKISMGLLEVMSYDDMPTLAEQYPNGTPAQQLADLDQSLYLTQEELAAVKAERDGLAEVVAMQMELIQPTADDTLQRLLDYYLLEVTGVSDWRAGDTKLGALVRHIRRRYG